MEPVELLRGSRSITGNNEALVVIDNDIFINVLQQLPPELIASVNVIKDGGAALYGEQGVTE
jgi:outer membrane receptor protein involved in Fe transport